MDFDDARRIPARLNLAIAAAITVVQIGLLVLVTRAPHGLWLVPALIVFGVTGITTYQAMHEAEHGILFKRALLNDLGGTWLAALFGGSFTFLRACHLGHHARNRTRGECFELVWRDQDMTWRRPLFYVVFLGGFWALVPLSCLFLAVSPPAMRRRFVAHPSRAGTMVSGMPDHWMRRMRRDAVFTIALHASLLGSGLVSPTSWLLCYAAVAVLWSSQNYLGHAHETSFEVVDGAFNLDVNPIYGAWIMNFHWHLAHHQKPQVPWVHLPRHDDPSRPHQSYARAYLRFLRGPVRAPPGAPDPATAP